MRLARSTWFWILALTAVALAIRLPYWRTMPSDYDEINQMVFSWRIINGVVPLTGNDAYTGPFFSYILALMISLGVREPFIGRILVLVSGTLTVPLTFLWVGALRRLAGLKPGRLAELLAAIVVAFNLHLVLLNSHIGGATYTLPFFTTVFLWLTTEAMVRRDLRWWLAGWVFGGFALQANPIAIFPLAGYGVVAFLYRSAKTIKTPVLINSVTGAGSRFSATGWWLFAAIVTVMLIYSPVILANLLTTARSLDVAIARDYLWQPNPTLATYGSNMVRLLLQIVRQTASAWQASETTADVTPIAAFFSGWAIAGLVRAPRQVRWLLLGCVLPYVMVVPWFARHYGALDPARFTTFMVPVLAAGMGLLVEGLVMRIGSISSAAGMEQARVIAAVIGAAAIGVMTAYWLFQLFSFYRDTEPSTLNGATINDMSTEMVRLNHGEPVYIGLSDAMLNIRGQPRVPIGFATMAQIGTDFIPVDEVIRRLYEFPGPATLMLANDDARRVQQAAPLVRLQIAASVRAQEHGYGLFVRDLTQPMLKPDFVLTGVDALAVVPLVRLNTRVGAGLELIGYDPPTQPRVGQNLVFTLYWRRISAMPIAQYMGFVHVVDKETERLVAQKDQRLGADRYPVNAWQLGEVIVEQYIFALTADSAPGNYGVRVGAYTFPDLQRLAVPGNVDNFVQLPVLSMGR